MAPTHVAQPTAAECDAGQREIADAVSLIFHHLRDHDADQFESAILAAGLLHRCRCGWNIPVDRMGERCESCGLIPSVDSGLRCGACQRPIVAIGETSLSDSYRHGRVGGVGIDWDAEHDHEVAPVVTIGDTECAVCYGEITRRADGTLVHVTPAGMAPVTDHTPVQTPTGCFRGGGDADDLGDALDLCEPHGLCCDECHDTAVAEHAGPRSAAT